MSYDNAINYDDAMSYDDAMRLNFDILDKIDLFPFITERANPTDIMRSIEDAYENHKFSREIEILVEDYDTLQGFLFNYVGVEDFIDYLHDRYGTTFNSEVKYWVVNRGIDA